MNVCDKTPSLDVTWDLSHHDKQIPREREIEPLGVGTKDVSSTLLNPALRLSSGRTPRALDSVFKCPSMF